MMKSLMIVLTLVSSVVYAQEKFDPVEDLTIRIVDHDDEEHYHLETMKMIDLNSCKAMTRQIGSQTFNGESVVMTCVNSKLSRPDFHVKCEDTRCFVMDLETNKWIPWKKKDYGFLEKLFHVKPYEGWSND